MKCFLGYEIEIKVIDESNGLKEAIVKIHKEDGSCNTI